MRFLRNIILSVALLSVALGVQSCGNQANKAADGKQIAVTIPPLKGLVKEIVGADYEVVCLLPAGSSPESYSPTARQIAALADAEFVFTIGTLAFEDEIVQRLDNHQNRVVKTAQGIELLTGCEHEHHYESGCSHEEQCAHCEAGSHNHKAEHYAHNHSHNHKAKHHAHNHSHNHEAEHHAHHHHSYDPHVWLAPEELGVIVDNLAAAITAKHPDSVKYCTRYEQLKAKLAEREVRYGEVLKSAPRAFLIYHPALGYLAEEYGLEQISLENEGKSPTPAALAGVVDRVSREHLESMFYQQEYPLDVVKPIAEILGVNLVEINPLSEDILSELDRIVATLINSK